MADLAQPAVLLLPIRWRQQPTHRRNHRTPATHPHHPADRPRRGLRRAMAKRRRPGIHMFVFWTLAGLAGVAVIVFALLVGPWLFTRHPENSLTTEQELKARNDVRTTLVQALAGLAVAGGWIVTYRTYRQTKETRSAVTSNDWPKRNGGKPSRTEPTSESCTRKRWSSSVTSRPRSVSGPCTPWSPLLRTGRTGGRPWSTCSAPTSGCPTRLPPTQTRARAPA